MAAHKTKALTFATSVILSLSLFLFGFVYIIIKSAHQAALSSQESIKLEVFFNEDLKSDEELEWLSNIQTKPEVLRTQVITKEQAQIEFKHLMKNEWGGLVEEASLVGRLPASLIVEFQQDISPLTRQKVAEDLMTTAAQFSIYDGSVFQKDWAQWFADYTVLARRLAITFGVIIFFTMYFIISNLIRSQVFHKADEIEIMSFLGATKWQIQKPFVLKAVTVGLLSTALSTGILFYLIQVTKSKFLAQSHLFSVDLVLQPSVLEVVVFTLTVCIISGWAAKSCVQDRVQT